MVFLMSDGRAAPGSADTVWSASLYPKYLGTIGSVIYDHPIIVNEATVSMQSEYAGIWNATHLGPGAYGKTYGDETDLYAGWLHRFGAVTYDVTALYFIIADLRRINDDLFVIDQKITLSALRALTPYIKLRSMNAVGRSSPEGGWFFWAGVSRSQDIGPRIRSRPIRIDCDGSVAYSDGPLGKSPGPVFARITMDLNLPISRRFACMPSIVWQRPLGNQAHLRHPFTNSNQLVWGITVVSKF